MEEGGSGQHPPTTRRGSAARRRPTQARPPADDKAQTPRPYDLHWIAGLRQPKGLGKQQIVFGGRQVCVLAGAARARHRPSRHRGRRRLPVAWLISEKAT